MDTIWIDDVLELAQSLNFSRAAERRHVTQSAMSRRIRSLETALGAPLFSRDSHRLRLTPAGETFQPAAFALQRRLEAAKREVMEAAALESDQRRFAFTHALSLTFFPAWLRRLERDAPTGAMQLTADSMASCERAMLEGRCQFLLCHRHPATQTALGLREFRSITLGHDTLVPVTAPAADGGARHVLPGTAEAPVPAVVYGEASGLGPALRDLVGLLGPNGIEQPVAAIYPIEQAARAVAHARTGGGRVLLAMRDTA